MCRRSLARARTSSSSCCCCSITHLYTHTDHTTHLARHQREAPQHPCRTAAERAGHVQVSLCCPGKFFSELLFFCFLFLLIFLKIAVGFRTRKAAVTKTRHDGERLARAQRAPLQAALAVPVSWLSCCRVCAYFDALQLSDTAAPAVESSSVEWTDLAEAEKNFQASQISLTAM
jgi:hypothetical protein